MPLHFDRLTDKVIVTKRKLPIEKMEDEPIDYNVRIDKRLRIVLILLSINLCLVIPIVFVGILLAIKKSCFFFM